MAGCVLDPGADAAFASPAVAPGRGRVDAPEVALLVALVQTAFEDAAFLAEGRKRHPFWFGGNRGRPADAQILRDLRRFLERPANTGAGLAWCCAGIVAATGVALDAGAVRREVLAVLAGRRSWRSPGATGGKAQVQAG